MESLVFIIPIAFVLLFVLWAIGTYNGLVSRRNEAKNARPVADTGLVVVQRGTTLANGCLLGDGGVRAIQAPVAEATSRGGNAEGGQGRRHEYGDGRDDVRAWTIVRVGNDGVC